MQHDVPIARWSYDASAGQIRAFDSEDRVLMVIPSGPLFAARLVAAFSSPTHLPPPRTVPATAPRLHGLVR
ncbi:hypothetical protein [Pelomonas cellulosilytica]|uniref:KTSC domain-containing protein n=1 Tax=Pelomonas cellulosilytica TaxID=2906762 RepID=A0ABS8XTU7_9BURK|nr:hypothetical protein [Pelomonas sp. P8]MCE4554725.1 hypothetical protein [Pelomonas sp. P8]